MSQRFESDFKGYKDLELFYQGWETDPAKGSIVIVHGQAEHSECYNHFAEFLNTNQWNVYAYDLRGHGKSEGQRGYAFDFSEYEKDTHLFIDLIKKQHHKSGPLFIFGHSMGGLVSLKTLIAFGCQDIAALTLSSPCLGLKVEVPAIKEKASSFLGNYLPRFTVSNELQFSQLTSIEETQESFARDTLRHSRISATVFLGMKQGFELIKKFNKSITCPVLMQLSGLDPICSPDSSKAFFNSLEHIDKKKLIVYEDSLHEIINDVEYQKVFDDYLSFINEFA